MILCLGSKLFCFQFYLFICTFNSQTERSEVTRKYQNINTLRAELLSICLQFLKQTRAMTTAEQLIARLELVRLPREGGWVRELGECAGRGASSILYLATRSCVTSWHSLGVEEYWCHHSGDNIRCVENISNNNSNSNINRHHQTAAGGRGHGHIDQGEAGQRPGQHRGGGAAVQGAQTHLVQGRPRGNVL